MSRDRIRQRMTRVVRAWADCFLALKVTALSTGPRRLDCLSFRCDRARRTTLRDRARRQRSPANVGGRVINLLVRCFTCQHGPPTNVPLIALQVSRSVTMHIRAPPAGFATKHAPRGLDALLALVANARTPAIQALRVDGLARSIAFGLSLVFRFLAFAFLDRFTMVFLAIMSPPLPSYRRRSLG